jgi:Flp pilus assembly protein TadD
MVFSSKSRSPYTQMFLTHIDENGDDSPAVLIENATAGNRAVNLPEFVNLPSGGWQKLDVPAADYYRVIDDASNLMAKSRFQEAVVEWRKALDLNPDEARPHNNLGYCLAEVGRHAEAVPHYERAIALSPEYPEAYNNLGEALIRLDRRNEAMDAFEKALRLNPRYASAHSNLGAVLAQSGRLDPAIEHFQQALAANPALADVHNNLAVALAMSGRLPEAIPHLEAAVRLTSGRDRAMLNLLAGFYRRAITAEMDPRMKRDLEARLGKLTQKR